MAVLGSGRDLNGRGTPVGFIWAEFQLKRSHGDPLRDQSHDFVRDQFLALTNYYLVLTTYHLVLPNDYLVVTIDYLVVTRLGL